MNLNFNWNWEAAFAVACFIALTVLFAHSCYQLYTGRNVGGFGGAMNILLVFLFGSYVTMQSLTHLTKRALEVSQAELADAKQSVDNTIRKLVAHHANENLDDTTLRILFALEARFKLNLTDDQVDLIMQDIADHREGK